MSTLIATMWNNKCPRCRQGKIFSEPFDIAKPLDMPERCEYCEQRTEPEPGFYYGAMFISYLLSVALLLGPTLTLVFYFKWSIGSAFGITIFLALVSYLKFLRVSRSVWLSLMVDHDPLVEQEVRNSITGSRA